MKRNSKFVQSRREFNKAVGKTKRFVQFQIISQDKKKHFFCRKCVFTKNNRENTYESHVMKREKVEILFVKSSKMSILKRNFSIYFTSMPNNFNL